MMTKLHTPDSRATAPAGLSRADTGMIAMVVAVLLLPVGDTLSKLLTDVLAPLEVATARFAAQGLFLAPFALLLRKRLRGAMLSPALALSAGLIATALFSLISALQVMPVATAISIFFVEPLLLTLLAWPLLGEPLGARRLAAVAMGLVGALIVIRPGFSAYGWTTLLPLAAAVTYALNKIVMRRASATRSPLTIQCGVTIYALLGLAALTVAAHGIGAIEARTFALPGWSWAAILAAGALSSMTFLLITEAFQRAEAGSLAPFQYLEILGATFMGWLVFGDLPDALTWLGVGIILASGLYVFHRERIQGATPPRRQRTVR